MRAKRPLSIRVTRNPHRWVRRVVARLRRIPTCSNLQGDGLGPRRRRSLPAVVVVARGCALQALGTGMVRVSGGAAHTAGRTRKGAIVARGARTPAVFVEAPRRWTLVAACAVAVWIGGRATLVASRTGVIAVVAPAAVSAKLARPGIRRHATRAVLVVRCSDRAAAGLGRAGVIAAWAYRVP